MKPLKPWRVTGTRTIYEDPYIRLRGDDCETEDGHALGLFHILEYADWVHVVAIDADDHVILVRQYRHGLGDVSLELPGGHVDASDGGDFALAASRELAEETGYAAEHWSVLLDVATSPGFTEETVRIYLATGLTEVGRPDSEHEEADLRVVRVPLTVAVESVLAGRIVNVMAVAGILAADAVLRGRAVVVDRDDDTQFDQLRPWTVFTGPGTPNAPSLDGSAPR